MIEAGVKTSVRAYLLRSEKLPLHKAYQPSLAYPTVAFEPYKCVSILYMNHLLLPSKQIKTKTHKFLELYGSPGGFSFVYYVCIYESLCKVTARGASPQSPTRSSMNHS